MNIKEIKELIKDLPDDYILVVGEYYTRGGELYCGYVTARDDDICICHASKTISIGRDY